MPLKKMKKVWDYCTYNKPFFVLVLMLFCGLQYMQDYYTDGGNIWIWTILLIFSILICGYGMTITRDRINNGIRLPKILIKEVLVLGVKSSIVGIIYLYIQGFVLDWICSPLNFPAFKLEEMLLDLPDTLNLLFSHNPAEAFTFVAVGSVLFYITTFFMEIAIARLADTGSILSAFNLLEIKKNIDTMGWVRYAKDYTLIILAIVIFSYLKHMVFPFDILNYMWTVLLSFFIFATQYLGIGAVYSKIKKKESFKEASNENI